jgi:hypothetical protein
MRARRGGRLVEAGDLAEVVRQLVDLAMHLRKMLEELEDYFDTRQIDAQIALKAHDRPEPADLLGLIAHD